MKTMIKTMLNLQNQFNEKLDKDWLNANWRWDYALMQEYSEAFAYIPWKWWKHETLDKDQLIMEMVDIFHFGMSFDMVDLHSNRPNITVSTIIDDLTLLYSETFKHCEYSTYDEYLENEGSLSFEEWNNECIKELIAESLSEISDPYYEKEFKLDNFYIIWNLLGLTIEDLYKKYIGKNVLNIFRQNHGYKSGEYKKIWNGLEDNEILTNLLNSLDCDEHLFDNVYKQLEESYSKV